MTQAELFAELKKLNMPVTYSHFSKPPGLPYLVYRRAESDDLIADNQNYKSVTGYDVELYTEKIDLLVEKYVEDKLKELRLPYSKIGVWIESEELYMIRYGITLT